MGGKFPAYWNGYRQGKFATILLATNKDKGVSESAFEKDSEPVLPRRAKYMYKPLEIKVKLCIHPSIILDWKGHIPYQAYLIKSHILSN